MLRDSFYTIQELQLADNQLKATVMLNAEHAIFKGHFPGNPITPGVVQLEMMKEIVNNHFKKNYKLNTLSNCKFLAILNPLEHETVHIQLSLNADADKKKLSLSGQITNGQIVFIKMKGVYKED